MAAVCVQGIPETVAAEVRRTMRAPEYGHPAHREVALGYGPCRLCLRTFAVGGEERILFTYQPFRDPGSLPAPGPVFVHARPCERYDAAEFPPDLRTLPLAFDGYDAGGMLVARERPGAGEAVERLGQLLDREAVRYVHIRNAEAGCFMARADRRD